MGGGENLTKKENERIEKTRKKGKNGGKREKINRGKNYDFTPKRYILVEPHLRPCIPTASGSQQNLQVKQYVSYGLFLVWFQALFSSYNVIALIQNFEESSVQGPNGLLEICLTFRHCSFKRRHWSHNFIVLFWYFFYTLL